MCETVCRTPNNTVQNQLISLLLVRCKRLPGSSRSTPKLCADLHCALQSQLHTFAQSHEIAEFLLFRSSLPAKVLLSSPSAWLTGYVGLVELPADDSRKVIVDCTH